MKVSKLINELIALKRKHGDIEVVADDPDQRVPLLHEISSVTHGAPGIGPDAHPYGDYIILWHWYGDYCGECGRGCD